VVPLREWLEAREPRERAAIVGGAVLLGLAVLWAYVWEPLAADRVRLVEGLPRLRVQAIQVKTQAGEVDQLRAAGRARGPAGVPPSAIEETMKSAGLADTLTSVSTLGEGRVQVALRPVAFDTLVRALAQLAEVRGVTVDSLVLKTAGEPGKVQVDNLVLRTPRGG